jgi:hypothetical protein
MNRNRLRAGSGKALVLHSLAAIVALILFAAFVTSLVRNGNVVLPAREAETLSALETIGWMFAIGILVASAVSALNALYGDEE